MSYRDSFLYNKIVAMVMLIISLVGAVSASFVGFIYLMIGKYTGSMPSISVTIFTLLLILGLFGTIIYSANLYMLRSTNRGFIIFWLVLLFIDIIAVPFNLFAGIAIIRYNDDFVTNKPIKVAKPKNKNVLSKEEAETEIEKLRFQLRENRITREEYIKQSEEIKKKIKEK